MKDYTDPVRLAVAGRDNAALQPARPNASGSETWPRKRRAIQEFDYQGVFLEPGLLQADFEMSKQFLLRIPNDDLLKPFRESAGHDAPGTELGGWYNDKKSHGAHIFGQFISALGCHF